MRLSGSKFHFIGVGGIGMSGLAEVLHSIGARVTGSDLSENAQTERLRELGVQVFSGHAAHQVGEPDVVVYSSAVKADNPEYMEARRRRIPLIPRAEALAEIMRLKRGIAVAGTHGKTTTTSLLASTFLSEGMDPTIVVGGRLDTIRSTALLGHGEWLVAEADESDGSFAKLSPEIVIITNIDSDHLDHYKSFANLKQAFFDFAQRIPFYGLAVVCGDDPVNRDVFTQFPKRLLTYGFAEDNDYILKKQGQSYEVSHGGQVLGNFVPPIPGIHNALNCLATIVVGKEVGLTFAQSAHGLAGFKGVDRRFQLKGERHGVLVYDDYGHHPTEVRAVLQAFREKYPDRRLMVAFQPHRYTRTQLCWQEFLHCFAGVDRLFLLDIYPAGEPPIEGISSQSLAAQMCDVSVTAVGPVRTALPAIRAEFRSGDIFVTLGAGNGWQLGQEFLADGELS